MFNKKSAIKGGETKILEEILKNQMVIAKKLDVLEQRLDRIEKRQGKGFGDILHNLFILYGKAVMTRLNLVELSKGDPISVSHNEQREIDNSMSDNPDAKMLVLPLPGKAFREEAKRKKRAMLN